MSHLIQITAPYFCAGLECSGRSVLEAAPIIRYMIGWDVPKVLSYVDNKGWTWEVVS